MPRKTNGRNYVFNAEIGSQVWRGIPSNACMRTGHKSSANPVAGISEEAARHISYEEKIGDIAKSPMERIFHYGKALAEYESAACGIAPEGNQVRERENALRVKGKIGESYEAEADALVKRAEKSSGKEAARLLGRALELCEDAVGMNAGCGNLQGSQRAALKMESLRGWLARLGQNEP